MRLVCLYKRFQNGEAQTDGNNGEQVAVKNVIIQICGWSRMSNDDEYLDMETMAGGNGYYITNGKAIPVTWSKDSLQAPTRYFDADGNEITLNQGKTWVCVTEKIPMQIRSLSMQAKKSMQIDKLLKNQYCPWQEKRLLNE